MLNRFLEFSERNRLFSKNNRVLLAVSGGIDSMVMLSLFRETGIRHAIAHCNFSLRGEESDSDEEFVSACAKDYNISYFNNTFDTLAYATAKGISVQMAARELRYSWFDKLITGEGFDAVAVAHNLNDNVETFFINLLRGTGLNGLTGINPRNGSVIRPLLFATRGEITEYAHEKGITFREDSSNSQLKYTRNRIRHKVLPELEGVSPNALSAIMGTIGHLNSSASIIEVYIEQIRKDIFKPFEGGVKTDISALLKLHPHEAIMFELFRKYNLSAHQGDDLMALLDSPSGKFITTPTHRILRDRERLIISEKKSDDIPDYLFSSIDEMSLSGLFSDLMVTDHGPDPLPSNQLTACLDLSLLKFPLRVRTWQHGDRFSPLGMTGMKKISDFLIDLKIPVTSKEKVLLLMSDDNVVWVMGYRIDNRYKVNADTKKILILSL